MKRYVLALLALLLLMPLLRAEERVWCLITDGGERVAMSDVLCLAAADDDSTFAVVLTDGSTIAGVRRAHFDIEIPTGLTKPGIINGRDVLHLTNAPAGSTVSIYSIDGKLMQQAKADEEIDISALPARAYYIIRLGETSFKFRKP
ncbi:MAG: T9SS type A sorting domain-containing protein [Bacteroidaceae bacterium]|nr:T9SS type A sorting domain-containing protein [Bacteroidaceae bacterium]